MEKFGIQHSISLLAPTDAQHLPRIRSLIPPSDGPDLICDLPLPPLNTVSTFPLPHSLSLSNSANYRTEASARKQRNAGEEMDILEQPIEAIAFRIYSLPEVAAAGAAAWTCLAAVLAAAAAAGLWRLRSSAPHAVTDAAKPLELETSPAPVSTDPDRPSKSTSSSPARAPAPRERYTSYYYDSGCVGCCDVGGDDEEDEDRDLEGDGFGVYGPSETDPFEWEVVRSLPDLRATTAGEGTGRHQNATALSGSVVRLWDQSLTAAGSPRRRSRAGTISIKWEIN